MVDHYSYRRACTKCTGFIVTLVVLVKPLKSIFGSFKVTFLNSKHIAKSENPDLSGRESFILPDEKSNEPIRTCISF